MTTHATQFPLVTTSPAPSALDARLARIEAALTTGPVPPTPGHQHTLADLLEAYAQEYLPAKAAKTRYQYARLYDRFRAEFGNIPLEALTVERLRTWRNALAARYAPDTVRRYMDVLSGPLTVAVRDYRWLQENPLRRVVKPPASPGRVRFLSAEERSRLLDACQRSRNPYLYPLVIVALTTGARKNELLQLRWSAVDLERGVLRLVLTKNRERRAVPLVGLALTLLRLLADEAHYLRPGVPWVFPNWSGDRPMRHDPSWQTATRRAGLEDFRFHDLRHTAASYLAMNGASLLDIATILGHKSLQVTKRYAHLADAHNRAVVERMTTQVFGPPATSGADERVQPLVGDGLVEGGPAEPRALVQPQSPPRRRAAPTAGCPHATSQVPWCAACTVVSRAEAVLVEVQTAGPTAGPPHSPRSPLEVRVLEALQALSPLPATSVQIGAMLAVSPREVRTVLQALALLGTVEHPGKGYYRHRPLA